jgi:hypothetical protein
MIKNSRTVSGFKPAHDNSARREGLPRVAGRPAGWATAWRPGPATEGGGNAPGKVAVARAHPSSGLMCEDGAEAARHCPTVAEVLW